jgi:pimeloyl-ACP methyl ester carboxylesterase
MHLHGGHHANHLFRQVFTMSSAQFLETAVVQDTATWRRTQDEIVVGYEVADDVVLERIGEHYAGTFEVEPARRPFEGPVLFITGRQDSVAGYRDAWRTLEHYPRATFAVLDRAGHNVHIEQPQLFALVHEWLDRVDEARSQPGDRPETPILAG